jgi:hypothetical protein
VCIGYVVWYIDMAENFHYLRDIFCAMALVLLIMSVCTQRDCNSKSHVVVQRNSGDVCALSVDELLSHMQLMLISVREIALVQDNQALVVSVERITQRFLRIKDTYDRTSRRETPLLGFLGPLYSVGKVATERSVKKRLARITYELMLLMKSVHIPLEKMFLQSRPVLLGVDNNRLDR